MNPLFNLLSDNDVIYAPIGINVKLALAKLHWIQEISGSYFMYGISYCDEYPFDEGANVFIPALDREDGLKLICKPEEVD
jgi:hypothetical protein